MAQGFVEEERQLMSLTFEDVKLECFCKFVYLDHMLNDTGGVEQAVAVRVRAVWLLIICTNIVLDMKDVEQLLLHTSLTIVNRE